VVPAVLTGAENAAGPGSCDISASELTEAAVSCVTCAFQRQEPVVSNSEISVLIV